MAADPFEQLGAFLTADEAYAMAAHFAAGAPTFKALKETAKERRDRVKELLDATGLEDDPAQAAALLRAISGAKSVVKPVEAVWTMPGNAAKAGPLNAQFHHVVEHARTSVTCATYNFTPGAPMWEALSTAGDAGAVLTIYFDRNKASIEALKQWFPNAAVYRSGQLPNGKDVVSHAKFVIIDHRIVLVSSANFSISASHSNVELGLRVDDPELAASIERSMTEQHGILYELVE